MDIKQLYRQVIMEHYKNPKNRGLIDDNDYLTIHLNNPSCGDELTVQLKVDNKKITDIRHDGTGCSICCSSASVMSLTLEKKSLEEAQAIIKEYYEMIKGYPFESKILIGDALAYQGVSQFPARIKCATLAYQAVERGISKLMEDKQNG